MPYDHEKECERYGPGGCVRRAFVTIIEPGKIPDGKGPFLTNEHLMRFVREAIAARPDRSTQIVVSELTWNDELWVDCGRQMIEIEDAFAACDQS